MLRDLTQLQQHTASALLYLGGAAMDMRTNGARAPLADDAASFQVPAGVKTKPWLHQIEAFNFAIQRLLPGGGAALLALEMGVGKTLVALMLMAALAAKRTLICCPLRAVPVWEEQNRQHLDLPLIVVLLDDNAGSVANKKRLAEEKIRLAEATGNDRRYNLFDMEEFLDGRGIPGPDLEERMVRGFSETTKNGDLGGPEHLAGQMFEPRVF